MCASKEKEGKIIVKKDLQQCKSLLFLYAFNVKGHGAESVVARNHRGERILHPAVEKVAFSVGKLLYKRAYTLPRALAKANWFLPVFADKRLPNGDVARMRDRVFVQVD